MSDYETLLVRTESPVCGISTDTTELKRAEEMPAAIVREREMLVQQRATQLAKANEALRGCLDALAPVLFLRKPALLREFIWH